MEDPGYDPNRKSWIVWWKDKDGTVHKKRFFDYFEAAIFESKTEASFKGNQRSSMRTGMYRDT